MDIWMTLVLVVHVVTALGIIGLVLLQHGKGADVGAAFGSGASGSLFGATGSANFLSRATAVLAVVFFLTSLGLAYLATHKPRVAGSGVMESGVPAAPAPSTATGSSPASKDGSALPAQDGGENSRANEVPK
jgi:preprotein translocase subunit SecG